MISWAWAKMVDLFMSFMHYRYCDCCKEYEADTFTITINKNTYICFDCLDSVTKEQYQKWIEMQKCYFREEVKVE